MSTVLDAFGNHDYLVRESLLLALVALGIYVLLSAGLFAVPQLGFMAVGGYTASVLNTDHGWTWIGTLPAALAAGALVGLVLGLILARLDGIYLALASIGFNEIVRVTARNLDITGGAVGIAGVERSTDDVQILLSVVIAVTLLFKLHRSRVGRAIEGMREDPLMAAHQGVSIRRYRLMLFAMSGVLASGGGALLVHLTGFIEPEHFAFPVLIELLASTVLGGMASVAGPFLGGTVVFGLPAVSTGLAEYRDLVNGVVIVVIIALVPGGLADAIGRLVRCVARLVGPSAATEDPAVASTTSEPSTARMLGPRAGPEPPAERAPVDGAVLLRVDGLSRDFGGVQALRSLSLDLRRGEVFGLIGPNGSGKTTFVNVVSGVYAPDAGEIVLDEDSLRPAFGRPERVRARGIARTFQGIRLIRGRSVGDNVLLGAHLAGAGQAMGRATRRQQAEEVQERIAVLLEELELVKVADREVASLSYGPQRRVEIARALVANPRLLLLDEPTAGMSPGERSDIFDLIDEVRHRGVTVVVVEHDVASIARACDRVAVLNFGEVIAVDVPERVLEEEVVVDAYIGRRSGH